MHLKKLDWGVPLSIPILEAALEKTKPNSSSCFFSLAIKKIFTLKVSNKTNSGFVNCNDFFRINF